MLAQACRSVGATQIRNMGTLGGNVANAAACADSLPALVCLDAVARVLTADGELVLPVCGADHRPQPHADPGGRPAGVAGVRSPGAGQPQRLLEAGPAQRDGHLPPDRGRARAAWARMASSQRRGWCLVRPRRRSGASPEQSSCCVGEKPGAGAVRGRGQTCGGRDDARSPGSGGPANSRNRPCWRW